MSYLEIKKSEHLFYEDLEKKCTYSEFTNSVVKYSLMLQNAVAARFLQKQDLKHSPHPHLANAFVESAHVLTEPKILIDIQDPLVFMKTVFACMHAGFCPVLWNSYFNDTQTQQILEQNTYAACITDSERWEQNLKNQNSIFILKTSELCLAESLDLRAAQEFEFHLQFHLRFQLEKKIIFFTSGTVQPKACVLTLENLVLNAQGSQQTIPYNSNHSWGLCLPHFHVGGFAIFIRTLLAKATVVAIDLAKLQRPQQQEFSLLLKKITHLSLVPTQLQRLNKNPFPHLQHVLLGGSAISTKLLTEKFQEFPLHMSYGMTEMGSQVATTPLLERREDLESLPYHILPYRELCLKDGCIAVSGKCLFQGYLLADCILNPCTDAYFLTQDQAQIKNGLLFLLGRKDRIFQSAGENISCHFIEEELLKIKNIEKVRIEPESDPEYGYVPVAYIQYKNISEADLKDKIKNLLPGLMRPQRFYSYQPKNWKTE